MMNKDLIDGKAECVVVMDNTNHYLRIDYTGDSLRVSDNGAFIKLYCFAPNLKGKFRVTIKVENILEYKSNRYDMERQSERIEDND